MKRHLGRYKTLIDRLTSSGGGRWLAALLLLLAGSAPVAAETVHVAVAANFSAAFKQLIPVFERQTGHRVIASYGATGKLYAQIRNGAPFALLLAADDTTPARLVREALAEADSLFVYASGRLVLWSASANGVDAQGEVLQRRTVERLAIANPKTAPYGRAAVETLAALGRLDALRPTFVTGENVAQTQQFIASGNAPLGFVGLSQVLALPASRRGSHWLVPATLHRPIDQAAVVLREGRDSPAARAFAAFLQSTEAAVIIGALGYELAPSPPR